MSKLAVPLYLLDPRTTLLSAICVVSGTFLSLVSHLQHPDTDKMTHQHCHEDCSTPPTGSGINGLIAAANNNDRFKLLEDESVLPADLDNPIHPIFLWFDCDGPLKQMLQLASHFLTHDSVLAFFVPLLYGRELKATDKGPPKTYLSDPFANISEEKRKEFLSGVRQALHCLAHSLEFRFMKPENRVYARTITNAATPVHTDSCSSVFQRKLTAKIEIADRFIHYYDDKDGYVSHSRCAQFRHDFLFAATLVHEIVHAIGVMRRGNLTEPNIRVDHPDTEWGYAWEHFMFGCVINPQDRTRPGTHLLMRKTWADAQVANDAGGKEYCDVAMSYIAQWFRKDTWNIVAEKGPTSIQLPTTHFKIQSSQKYGAWVISTDCDDIKHNIVKLYRLWTQQSLRFGVNGKPFTIASKIRWNSVSTDDLQRSNVPIPFRSSRSLPDCPTHGQTLPTGKGATGETVSAMPCSETSIIRRISLSIASSGTRKRRASTSLDDLRAKKVVKQ
jgi:hypothetical protein